jgi:hypothetical protein
MLLSGRALAGRRPWVQSLAPQEFFFKVSFLVYIQHTSGLSNLRGIKYFTRNK